MFQVQFISPMRADFVTNGSAVIRYLAIKDQAIFQWSQLSLEKDSNAGIFR